MTAERPAIPTPIKRAVRQRCAFGCVICGLPLYEYDHIEPYTTVQRHEAENIALLCDQHHREKTSGLLPQDDVLAAAANPHNAQRGRSGPYTLHYKQQGCIAEIGGTSFVTPTLEDGASAVPLIVDDTPIVGFELHDGHLLLTVQLFDKQNEMLVQIVQNELVYSTKPWDIEFAGRDLTVRSAAGEIFVGIQFAPPNRITINRGRIFRNGYEIRLTPTAATVYPGELTLRGSTRNSVLGVAIGDSPSPPAAALRMRTTRGPFPTAAASTEPDVLKYLWIEDSPSDAVAAAE